eukprot:m.71477 g.71477  ORF g.71477 m.71477 type:complete len:112 (-) comp16904_c0_seq3:1113-1448(-)
MMQTNQVFFVLLLRTDLAAAGLLFSTADAFLDDFLFAFGVSADASSAPAPRLSSTNNSSPGKLAEPSTPSGCSSAGGASSSAAGAWLVLVLTKASSRASLSSAVKESSASC